MKNNEDKVVSEQMKMYRETLSKHGNNPLGIGWNNRETQFLRFDRLIWHFDFSKSENITTLHDVGAGLADMSDYLSLQEISCDYSGTEIVQEMINLAKEKNPALKLYNRNILDDSVSDTYDYVVLSGAFNKPGHIDAQEWQQFVFAMISKMFRMCNKAISFNCLTTYKTMSDSELFYMSPEEMFAYCMKHLSRFVVVDHAYALYEYTVTVFKKDYVAGQYDPQIFGKYFRA